MLGLRKVLEPDVSLHAKLIGVAKFLGNAFDSLLPRIAALEEKQLEKGEKGERGESVTGSKGDRGADGAVGPQGLVGPVGPAGKDGKSGKAGKDGVSVVDSEIAADGHLVLKLSSGAIIDAGPLPESDAAKSVFVSGNAYQITVSATAPSGPQVNDLWLDIS